MDNATTAILAELAAQAYAKSDYPGNEPLEYRLPEGWSVVGEQDLGLSLDDEGFYHVVLETFGLAAYVATNGSETALVFRGSDDWLDYFLDGTWVLAGRAEELTVVFHALIESAKSYASSQGTPLYVAGHSLGGVIAESVYKIVLGIAGGVGIGSPGPDLFDSGADSRFVHVYRDYDAIGWGYALGHVGVTTRIIDKQFDSVFSLLDAHNHELYSNQIGIIATSELPQYLGLSFDRDRTFLFLDELAINAASPGEFADSHASFGSNLPDLINVSGLTASVRIDARGGNDTVYSGNGSDFLFGGEGNDDLRGAGGADTIFGGSGTDTIYGGEDADLLRGGDGDDVLIKGESGRDTIYGDAGNDALYGDEGGDELYGGVGDDYLNGGADSDWVLKGGLGNDTILGGSGNDLLFGEEGDDHLNGGAGSDRLEGGGGADTFVFTMDDLVAEAAGRVDLIIDYNKGTYGSPIYSPSEGDSIDISAIVGSALLSGEAATSLWKIERDSLNFDLKLFVDPDGAGSTYTWIQIAAIADIPVGHDLSVVLDPTENATPDAAPTPSSPGSWSISQPSNAIAEGGGSLTFTITRPDDTTNETVYISTVFNRGALNEGDYVGWLNVPISFSAGVSELEVEVLITDDGVAEASESFGLIVQSSPDQPTSQFLANTSFTIIDDDNSGPLGEPTSGDDTVIRDALFESIDGGAGFDSLTLNYAGATYYGYDISYVSMPGPGELRYQYTGANGFVTQLIHFSGFEQFDIAGTYGNDTLRAGSAAARLYGLAGADQIHGGTGADVLDGGAGDDAFHDVGYGDTVDGGSGTDTLTFDLSTETADLTLNLLTGEAPGGVWTNVEVVGGQLGSGDDTVLAAGLFRSVDAGDGFDSLTLNYAGAAYYGYDISYVSMPGPGELRYQYTGANGFVTQLIHFSGFEQFDIAGTYGNDTLRAGIAAARLYGLAGADQIYGGAGADVLDGGAGDDAFHDVGYGDTVDGGSGTDTLTFDLSTETADLTLNLLTGEAPGGVWTNVEVVGGQLGSGDDTVVAAGLFRSVDAGDGFDSLTLNYAGAAYYGYDISYVSMPGPGELRYQYTGANGFVTQLIHFSGFEQFDIAGTYGNDTLRAGSAAARLYGLAGADQIHGGTGADVLDGGAGDDAFHDVGYGDTVDGGSGTDTLTFDLSTETADLTLNLLTGEAPGGVWTNVEVVGGQLGSGDDTVLAAGLFRSVDAGDGFDSLTLNYAGAAYYGYDISYVSMPGPGELRYQYTGANGFVTQLIHFSGFEQFDIAGTYGNDTLRAGATGSHLYGLEGSDRLHGGDGADHLYGGLGGDALIGGAGFDYARYDDATSGLTAHLALPNLNTGEAAGDSYNGIEGLVGTSYADILAGDAGDNWIYGGDGYDQIYGAEGNDFLFAYLGPLNFMWGGLGADVMTGGLGLDFARYDYAATGVVANLGAPGGNAGEAAGDQYNNIEGLVGSTFGDTLVGDGGNNEIYGIAGDDWVYGQAGNDFVFGDAGNDHLEGGAGADYINGGSGFDFARYDYAESAVTAHLLFPHVNQGDAAGDGYQSIEGLVGSNFGDTLAGDNANNTIYGLNGNDTIYGLGGADLMYGGGGADIFAYVSNSDSTPDARDYIGDFQSGSDKIDLSGLYSGGSDQLAIYDLGGGTYQVNHDQGGNGSVETAILVNGFIQASDIILGGAAPAMVGEPELLDEGSVPMAAGAGTMMFGSAEVFDIAVAWGGGASVAAASLHNLLAQSALTQDAELVA